MPLNTDNLENRIQQKIDGLTTSNNSIEFVIPGMTEAVNVKSSVANTASLPNIYTDGIPNGTVVFVESLGVPVVASKCSWLGLDGRFLQKDAEFGLWSWGDNLNGRLGDGTVADRSSPVSVVGGFSNWCKLSLGSSTSAGLRSNGTIWTWGSNLRGELGDRTIVSKSSPVSVVGGVTDWTDVSVGNQFVIALRANGTLWSWGDSTSGQGGGSGCFCSPKLVDGYRFTDWCQISAGGSHSVALRTNGTLWSFGSNSIGF
jgi:alpha-tubulin suppressor-like RCC1 family protein